MTDRIVQIVNPNLCRQPRHRGHQLQARDTTATVVFSLGQPIALNSGLALAFFFDRQENTELFPFRRPQAFNLTVRRESPNHRQQFCMRHGDILELPERLRLWPVAFDIDPAARTVHAVVVHLEGPAVPAFDQCHPGGLHA